MRLTQKELKNILESATDKVTIGGLYIHYKSPENIYKVLQLAIIEADNSVCVVYEAQYGEKLVFVRPLSSWLDTVEWEGKAVKRFTAV